MGNKSPASFSKQNPCKQAVFIKCASDPKTLGSWKPGRLGAGEQAWKLGRIYSYCLCIHCLCQQCAFMPGPVPHTRGSKWENMPLALKTLTCHRAQGQKHKANICTSHGRLSARALGLVGAGCSVWRSQLPTEENQCIRRPVRVKLLTAHGGTVVSGHLLSSHFRFRGEDKSDSQTLSVTLQLMR